MRKNISSFTWILCASCMGPMVAGAEEPSWLAPSIGPLSPSIHLNAAVGNTSGDAEALAVGHHDPSREDVTVQGLELGLTLRQGQLEGFAVHALSYGAEEVWDHEWEEAFLKLRDLPGGFELRGGRMLGRFGQHNALHLHAWNFVDTPLVIGRFLGEHGLRYDGGDVTWLNLDIDSTLGLTIGYGKVIEHDHEHGHHHDEHEEDEGEDHHAENPTFGDEVISSRFFGQYRPNDYRTYEAGVSTALGDDADGHRLIVYGLDVTYRWREKGLESGGRALTWTTEALGRDAEEGGSEFGFNTDLIYTFDTALDVGARLGYVEGDDERDSERRIRISPMVTAYLDPYRRAALRLQYNYDDVADDRDEHAIWLQLGLHWGGAEVR